MNIPAPATPPRRSRAAHIAMLAALATGVFPGAARLSAGVPKPSGQSVVFLHPDGSGLTGWNLHRILRHGPDGLSQWDQLPRIAVYRGHMRDDLGASSHGGGTIHAYGVKVPKDSYGLDGKLPLKGASGFDGSVMDEARAAGILTGIINSGHLAEPGTACMLASVEKRTDREAIVAQILASGTDIILGGGEILFLPRGTRGVHGANGTRADGRNLIEEAKKAGYTVIFRRNELAALPANTPKVLGLFAAENTYNEATEEALAKSSLPPYAPDAPTVAEMTAAALRLLGQRKSPFFLMVEEEGTDNFANALNAPGTMEAFRRADEALAVIRPHVAAHPDKLTLLVAADSEASSAEIVSFGLLPENASPDSLKPLPATTAAGAPLDGADGTGSRPFVSAPDQSGRRHLFGIAWIDGSDHFGGVLARAEGSRADRLPINLDNTGIYQFLRGTLFQP